MLTKTCIVSLKMVVPSDAEEPLHWAACYHPAYFAHESWANHRHGYPLQDHVCVGKTPVGSATGIRKALQ